MNASNYRACISYQLGEAVPSCALREWFDNAEKLRRQEVQQNSEGRNTEKK